MLKNKSFKNDITGLLIIFYLVWKMPIFAYYLNTYIAIILLFSLAAVMVLTGTSILKEFPIIFLAVILIILLDFFGIVQDEGVGINALVGMFLDALPVYLGYTLIRTKRFVCIKIIVPIVLIINCITAITTYIGLYIYPNASRELATGVAETLKYYKYNIGGFSFIYSLVLFHPLAVSVLRKKKKTVLAIGYSIINGFCIVKSNYTIATLLFFISCFTYLLPINKSERSGNRRLLKLLIFFALIAMFVPAILEKLAEWEILGGSSEKLLDIANFLQGKETSEGDFSIRRSVYSRSWNTFKTYFIFGSRINGVVHNGGHSFVLDMLSDWGLIGLAAIIFVLYRFFRWHRKLSKGSSLYSIVLFSYGLLLALIILNPHFWFFEFGFLIPLSLMYMRLDEVKEEK